VAKRKRGRTDGREARVDALGLVTGAILRSIGSVSASTIVPGGKTFVAPRSLRQLVVPSFYFDDGRDHPVRMPAALSYGHRVEVLEMCVALSGSPLLVVEGDLYRLADERLAILCPGVMHYESCGNRARPYELVWLIMAPDGASLHVTHYTPKGGYVVDANRALGRPGSVADEIVSEMEEIASGGGSIERLRAALASFASRSAQFLLAGGREARSASLSVAVERARQFIRTRYAEPISVADVAEAAHLSPNYLSSVFKDATGHTVLEEIHGLKLAEAKSRLRESDAPVKQIARELGFDSAHYFSRFFHRATGATPSEYRAGRTA